MAPALRRGKCLHLKQTWHFYPRHPDAANGGPAQSPGGSQLAEQLTATIPSGDTCAEPSSRTQPHNYLQLPANSIHLNDKQMLTAPLGSAPGSIPQTPQRCVLSRRHQQLPACNRSPDQHPGRRNPSPKKPKLQLSPATLPASLLGHWKTAVSWEEGFGVSQVCRGHIIDVNVQPHRCLQRPPPTLTQISFSKSSWVGLQGEVGWRQHSFFKLFVLYWSIANYECCDSFMCTDSAICIHVSILPQTPLPSRFPHNFEQSFLCYTVGPCWLSILFFVFLLF